MSAIVSAPVGPRIELRTINVCSLYILFCFLFLIWALESTIWRKSADHTTRHSSSSQALSFLPWHLSLGWIFLSSLLPSFFLPSLSLFPSPFLSPFLPSFPSLFSFLIFLSLPSFSPSFHPYSLQWRWEKMKTGEEGDDRGWGGWMASPTGWTWVWACSRRWWWTGKPGALQSIGLQRVRHDWTIELIWSLPYPSLCPLFFFFLSVYFCSLSHSRM